MWLRGFPLPCSALFWSIELTHTRPRIDIIGRSLAFSGADNDSLAWGGSLEDVFASLERAEHYSFLGCPAELLQIITLVSARKSSPHNPPPDAHSPSPMTDTSTLLARIKAFDPQTWIDARLPSLNHNTTGSCLDPTELYHHVCAYKCAVHIFALQFLVLPPLSTAPSLAQQTHELTNELISHISHFSPGSVFFKGAVWPVFLAGASATNEFQRDFVRRTLKEIWSLMPQINVKNAGTLLESMWADGHGSAGDWKERLKRYGSDYLFI
jgi:Fungal specific transcription factor domain